MAFRRFGHVIAGLTALGAAALGGCGVKLLSWDQEIALGSGAAADMTAEYGGAVDNEETRRYLDAIGHRLVAQIGADIPPDLPWEFTLLNSPVINAFALPGGKVYVSRGLVEMMTNEAQLAGVVGHEIGHVTARHGNERISAQIGLNAILVASAAAVGAADEESDVRRYGQYGVPALAIGGNVLLLKYGRDDELEADALGVAYMAGAGYDPRGQLQVMRILAEAGKGPRQLEFLSTHPHPESRIRRIADLLAGPYAYTQRNPDHRLYAGRFRQRMLDVLETVPAPPGSRTAGTGGAADVALHPSLWCAQCAGGLASGAGGPAGGR